MPRSIDDTEEDSCALWIQDLASPERTLRIPYRTMATVPSPSGDVPSHAPPVRNVRASSGGTRGMLCWPEARKARLARPTQDEGTDDHNCDHSESDTTVESLFECEPRQQHGEQSLGVQHAAVRESNICVTCTTSREALLCLEDVTPGTFIAAPGADNSEKQELQPELIARSKVVADVLEQCPLMGGLRHALETAAITLSDVHAELGEVVAGEKPGRQSDDEIIVFDRTGMALQDVAAASVVYEKATHSTRFRSMRESALPTDPGLWRVPVASGLLPAKL